MTMQIPSIYINNGGGGHLDLFLSEAIYASNGKRKMDHMTTVIHYVANATCNNKGLFVHLYCMFLLINILCQYHNRKTRNLAQVRGFVIFSCPVLKI